MDTEYNFHISSIQKVEIYSPAFTEVYTRMTNDIFRKSYYSDLETICDKCGEIIENDYEESNHNNCNYELINELEIAEIAVDLFNEGDNIIVITSYVDDNSDELKTFYLRKRETQSGE